MRLRPYIVMAASFSVLFCGPIAAAQSDGTETAAEQNVDTGGAAISAFYDLCAAPFPDKEDFLNGMAQNAYGFKPTPTAKLPHRWASGRANLVYADENMTRGTGQPAPQCVLDAVISKSEDHLALAQRVERVLLIDDGASSGRGGVNRTTWNYTDAAGNQLRIFFQTRPSNTSLLARLTLLRIAAGGGGDQENPIETIPNEENEVSL